MDKVKSDNVKSGEVKYTCELCEVRGGCRSGKEVMTEIGQNQQLERLIEAMNANTRSLLGYPPETQAQRELREKENLIKEEEFQKVRIETEKVKKEIGELNIFEEFAKTKLKVQQLTDENAYISDMFDEVMEKQAKMQEILNYGFSLKHPTEFEHSDTEEALKFEMKEKEIKHDILIEEANLRQREESSLDSAKNREMIDEAIEQVKIRLKPFGNVRNSAYRQPKHRSDTKIASKCASCNFMTPCKERFEKHMIEHKEGFKCEHCDQNISTRKDLKEHIFMEHKSTIICSFFIRGNCTRDCGFSHPSEVKYCRYSAKCPFLESGRCRYFHKMLPMWKNVYKKTYPEPSYGEKT